MQELLETINTFSQIIIALGVIMSAIFLVFKKVREMVMEGIRKGLGIDKMSDRISKMSDRIDEMSGRIDQTNDALRSLIEVLKKSKTINSPEFNVAMDFTMPKNLKTHSPVQLTDEGLEKLQDSGLEGIIDKEKQYLFSDLEKMGVESKFDIQNNSFYVMADYLKDNKEVLDRMKEYAFHKGIFNLKEFIQVGGIYLRDQYFKDKNILIASSDDKDKKE